MTPIPPAVALPQPFDAAFLADPYPGYARLREAGAVHRIALPDGSPVWLVTREADVRAWIADPRLSVNKARSGTGYRGFTLPPALDANLLNIDPEDHLRLRRLVSQAFTPRRVEELGGRVRAAADRLADRLAASMAAHGRADVVAEFALPLPLTVIGDLLGVPEADRRPFAARVGAMLAPEHPGQVAESVEHIHGFLLDLVAARRAVPGDDLLSALIAAHDDGDRLSEDELVSLAFLILMAGSENAQHLISGGLLALLRHPGQLAEVSADPGRLLPAAVEELLRWAHPNQMAIRRFPVEPVEIGGVSVPAGDTVLLCLASAHRDPARYPDPDRFDIHRADTSHLALGHGVHYCLGAPLARLEIRTALGTLLRRFPGLRLAVPADELRWRCSFRSRALRELPVMPGAAAPGRPGRRGGRAR
ncbi:cytochrome P450 [Streptomyces sp. NPDC049577]|uniref:cytochrome P450 family protein n=1 Tax=Streptomyces sp. NPDC049577 TaxID=3155153 RepID=UPI00343203EE